MAYGSENMTLTDTAFSTSGGDSPPSVSTISGFEHAILAAGTGDFTLDASGFSGTVLLQGGTGNDTLIGTSGPDTLVGGAGNDSLVGGGGADTFTFNGGSNGSQTITETENTGAWLDFSQAPDGISINLSQTGPQTVIPGILTLTLTDPLGINNVLGSSYNDTIIGNALDNTLIGAGGDDLIAGLGGNDVLEGSVTRTVYLDFNTFELPSQHFYTTTERDEIQAQITADYADFSYSFTQTQPQSGPYTTIYFNDPTLVGLEGGIATGIDWRDLDISGTTTLATLQLQAVPFGNTGIELYYPVGGLQIDPPDTAGVNVNNLLGGPGEPAATSADFVGLSTTIAAHELGHISGLEHGDAYGPIGSGIYVGVDPALYNPPYTGPTNANETILHIMASGASVGSTLEDAINDPFFGEREAIALAFGEDGTPTNEQTTPHDSMANAQPLALQPLVVPDTNLEGANADQIFNVTAADVVGYLGLNSSGTSETDYYSFSGQAGTLINFQVLSALLNRPGGAFDSTLTIYNSSGQVIAYNDDSFQDTDSTIVDLTIPTTGTYYVEVTASANEGVPITQTGDYELFMYTFSTTGDPPAGDTVYGGPGNDTIMGGTSDDTVAALPQDSIIYGSGTITLLSAAPYLDVTAGPNQSVNEGTPVTLTGSYIDPFENATHSYDWHVIAPTGQEIADGSGTSFTFTPGNAGTYTVIYSVSDPNGGGGSAQVVITSDAVTPILNAPTTPQSSSAGINSSLDLGTLTVAGIGPWTDTISWGDGQTSTFSPSGSGPLSFSHDYAQPGTYTVFEKVSEFDGNSASTYFYVNVTTPLTSTELSTSSASVVFGQPATFMAIVTGFGVPSGSVAFYSGTVNAADQIAIEPLGVVNNQDEATFTTSSLTPSTSAYAITAVYLGDSTHTSSTSNEINETVNPDSTTTTPSSSTAYASYGQAVTLKATVTANAPGAGSPTQTVDFYDNTTQTDLGKVQVVGGVATLPISTLPVGTQNITETYSGDTNFSGSSATLSESISRDATTTTASSSSATTSLGQAITLKATVVANAPGSGTPTQSVDFYDTTTQMDLGTAQVIGGVASISIATLPVGAQTITETYSGDTNFSPSSATDSQIVLASVYVLNTSNPSPTLTGTLYLSSSADLIVPGQVIVDSPGKPAVALTGTSEIIASYVGVAGSVSQASTATISPTPKTGSSAVSTADPLASLAVPNVTGTVTAVNFSSGTHTISPGIYSQIMLSGTANVTMNPGIYVITGGGFSVTSSATVTGKGVTIYNASTTYPATGGTYGGITLSSTGPVSLSAPTTGTYAGILIFQARTNPTVLTISGNSTYSISGTIYASDALLSVSGSVELNDALVVNRLQISGSAGVSVSTAQIESPAVQPVIGSTYSSIGSTQSTSTPSASSSPLVSSVAVLNQVGQSTTLTVTPLVSSGSGSNGGGSETNNFSSPELDTLTILLGQPGDSNLSTTETTRVAALADQAPTDITTDASLHNILSDATGLRDDGIENDLLFHPARLSTGIVADSVLNDLVASFVPMSEQGPAIAMGSGDLVSLGIVQNRADSDLTRVRDPRLTPVPAGPMSRQERRRKLGDQETTPTDVVLVAGLCGISAGLTAVEGRRSRTLSLVKKLLNFRP